MMKSIWNELSEKEQLSVVLFLCLLWAIVVAGLFFIFSPMIVVYPVLVLILYMALYGPLKMVYIFLKRVRNNYGKS